jgi:hypothetical protein
MPAHQNTIEVIDFMAFDNSAPLNNTPIVQYLSTIIYPTAGIYFVLPMVFPANAVSNTN